METIMMQRANVVLRVSPQDKDRYLANGYSAIAEDGTILEAALPQDIEGYKILVAELQAEIAKKDEEIARLSAKPKKTSKSE